MIKRPRPRVRLTRREIFIRDHHACQYCGIRTRDLTLDHVMPRHRGGRHSWDNLVSACRTCNHRKGGRTPDEARMLLRRAAKRAAGHQLLPLSPVPGERALLGLDEVHARVGARRDGRASGAPASALRR